MWRSGIAGPAVGVPSLVLLTVMAFKLAYLLTGSSDWVLQFAGRVARLAGPELTAGEAG